LRKSPAAKPARLARPLLIIAGGTDPVVPVADVNANVARLQAEGTPDAMRHNGALR
jgi:fermentation-respiration switch protein FrsA (DUF1100 family)